MTDSGQPPSTKFEAEDELDYLFANASPNPNREGCPSREDLVRVSRLEKPIGDPVYMHIIRCSPCFQEMRALQQSRSRTGAARKWAVAAAAVVALVTGASWWMARSGQSADSAVVATTIDLRPFAVMRGETQSPQAPSVTIPRARLDATILLPLGAEAGPYELQVRDTRSVRVAATGVAELQDSVTTLRVELDTAEVLPGPYRLEVRRAGGEWLSVPATLE